MEEVADHRHIDTIVVQQTVGMQPEELRKNLLMQRRDLVVKKKN